MALYKRPYFSKTDPKTNTNISDFSKNDPSTGRPHCKTNIKYFGFLHLLMKKIFVAELIEKQGIGMTGGHPGTESITSGDRVYYIRGPSQSHPGLR